MNGKGEAAKQANSIERTTEEGGNRGDPSEFARKKQHPYEKGSAERATSIYSLQESEREKTEKLMFGRSPALLGGT